MVIEIHPSSLNRILKCGMSVYIPHIKIPESEKSIKGTIQHELAQKIINRYNSKKEKYYVDSDHQLEINTKKYVDYILEKRLVPHIEKKLSYLYRLNENIWIKFIGTPDCFYISHNMIEVIDLKTGQYPVSPLSNQLKGYAFLIWSIDELPILDINFRLTIFQNEIPYSIDVKWNDISFITRLKNSILNKTWEVGDHCYHCPAKSNCMKFKDTMNLENISYKTEPDHNILKKEKLIKKYLDDTRAYFIKEKPDLFKKTKRMIKVWKENYDPPTQTKPLTPLNALKQGYDVKDYIDYKPTYIYTYKG